MDSNLIVGLLALAFVFMKSTPDWMLQALHHPVIMFVTLLALLWFVNQSKLLGAIGLLWIGSLYLERNRRTLHLAHSIDTKSLAGDPTMPKSNLQREVPYMRPHVDNWSYEPASGCAAQNEWSPVAPTIDHKAPPLETVPLGEKTGTYLMSRQGGWWKSMFGMFD